MSKTLVLLTFKFKVGFLKRPKGPFQQIKSKNYLQTLPTTQSSERFYSTFETLLQVFFIYLKGNLKMVEGAGFEPAKHEAADLQSAGFDRSPTPPSA